MDYNDILPGVCNLTQESELPHPRLWTLSIQKAMKKEGMHSFKFYTLIASLQAL